MGLHRVPATIQPFLGRNLVVMRTITHALMRTTTHARNNQIAIQYVPGITRIWHISRTWYLHKELYTSPKVKKADVGISHETENRKENVGVRISYVCTQYLV